MDSGCHYVKHTVLLLFSNFRRVLNIVFVLLGISPASDAGEIPKRTNKILSYV
jgi:hypothetical protein